MKDTSFTCPISSCSHTFSSKAKLQRHYKSIHLNRKNFKCAHCEKVLSSKQNLQEHIYIHTGEKPYMCDEYGCGMKFRQGSQLSSHKRIHRAIKKHSKNTEITTLKLTECMKDYEGNQSPSSYNAIKEETLVALPPLDPQKATTSSSLPPISHIDEITNFSST